MLNYAITSQCLIPLRAEPSHRSEMVSQLLFGETFEVLEQRQSWLRINTEFDNYEGWIPEAQSEQITAEDFKSLSNNSGFLSYDLLQVLINKNSVFSVVLGSNLPFYENRTCRISDRSYSFEGNARKPDAIESKRTVLENAYMFMNAPYLWGGRSPFGIDCSGYTQMVYKLSGIKLQRDAHQQAQQGQTVHLLDEAHPGDMAFFDNEEGKITHVGMLLSNNKIIHSSGKVRIDNIDHHGIYNGDTKRYSHNLRLIRRVL